ncbi:MAG: PH domain-containing protein [Dermabacter sp.]|nr:PH domain-containing protein [Dermabacter sp.]
MSQQPPAPNSEVAAAANPNDPPESAFQRFHPLTPLVAGWQVVILAVAILGFQGFANMALEHFTWTRLLATLGMAAALIVIAVGFSFIGWRATKFAVTDDGVFVRRKLIGVSRRIAPRERIDAVSIERPFVARLVGLSKVRVELAGSGDSHVDLAFLSRARAEEIQAQVLELARQRGPAAASGADTGAGAGPAAAEEHPAPAHAPGAAPELTHEHAPHQQGTSLESRVTSVLLDGDGEGELLAKIPTTRLLHSMVRDLGLVIGVVVTMIAALAWLLWQVINGFTFSFAALIWIIPLLLAAPRLILNRLEVGWGFVSRATSTGMRARRGLINSRSDNLSALKIQAAIVRRPVLWRGPGWSEARVSTAGMDEMDDSKADRVLPVGTASELRATLDHLLAPVGRITPHPSLHAPARINPAVPYSEMADTDLIEAFATLAPSELPGTHPRHWRSFIARRRTRYTLTEHALVHRYGLLSAWVQVIPRDRIQSVAIGSGPLERRWGQASVTVAYAGGSVSLNHLPAADALALWRTLGVDAGTHRRYSDRARWAMPKLQGVTGEAAPS